MQSNIAPEGMVVTPHHLASQSALAILREGGTAMEAMVAAAATIAVVYPHLNGIGGDGFWLIIPPHEDLIGIDASGSAGSLATEDFFKGLDKIPYTGPKAGITIAGTVGGWQEALNYVTECGYQKMSTSKLLADAIKYAEEGFPMTLSLRDGILNYKQTNSVATSFDRVFLPNGVIPAVGERFCQKTLAKTLKDLAENGLNSFYHGNTATEIAEDMTYFGLPITKSDLANYSPIRKVPLRLLHKHGELFNLPPPTQGLVSLSTLGILDMLEIDGKNEGQFIHASVEAFKQAFSVRDQYLTDPNYMTVDAKTLLSSNELSRLTSNIDLNHAASISKGNVSGDTVWMGIMDSKGFSVSFIQSTYHEFGSGVLLPKTGILWHNRGVGFSLDMNHIRAVKPGKKPLSTLNPAAAILNDRRVIIYGTRGGDGQPQTQATLFHRYVVQNKDLQTAVSEPRWVYGQCYGEHTYNISLEDRFDEETVKYLKDRGHRVEMLPPYSQVVGHIGALVRHPNGMMEGAFDPRSNGSAVGF